jgi:hypothetical protein
MALDLARIVMIRVNKFLSSLHNHLPPTEIFISLAVQTLGNDFCVVCETLAQL